MFALTEECGKSIAERQALCSMRISTCGFQTANKYERLWFSNINEEMIRMVVCCDDMSLAMDREMIAMTEKYQIRDGRIMNDIETEFFLRSGDTSGVYTYLGLNYCPFCGRPLSRGLWFAEKKK